MTRIGVVMIGVVVVLPTLVGCPAKNPRTNGGGNRSTGENSRAGDGSLDQLTLSELKPGIADWTKQLFADYDITSHDNVPTEPQELVAVIPTGVLGGRLACTPDGLTIALSAYYSRKSDDRIVRHLSLWDMSGAAPKVLNRIDTLDPPSGNNLYSLSFSADGKRLATGDADEVVTLYDVSGGELQPTSKIETYIGSGIYHLALSPDGTKLAAAARKSHDTAELGKIQFWELSGEKPEKRGTYTHQRSVYLGPGDRLRFSQDGQALLVSSSFILDADKAALLPLPAPGGSDVLAWSDDLKRVAVKGEERTIVVYDRDGEAWKQQATLVGHKKDGPGHAEFSPDGKRLVSLEVEESGSTDRVCRCLVWSIANESIHCKWDEKAIIAPLLFTEGGDYLITRLEQIDHYGVFRLPK